MGTTADLAWAFAIVAGPVLLALAIVLGIVRSGPPPLTAREASRPRSYPQRSDRALDEATGR